MGKSRKSKRRRSSSTSSSRSHERVSSRDLIKRLQKLEHEVKRRRHRSRSHHRKSQRRPRSRSSGPNTPVSAAAASHRARPDSVRACSRSHSHSSVPRPSDTVHAPGSPVSTSGMVHIDTCSVYEEPDEVLLIHNDDTLPDEVLKILGDNPEQHQEENFQLHTALTPRWRHNLVQGLKKEEANTVITKYKTPVNLSELNPPQLNPEILSLLDKHNRARDGSYVEVQKQLSSGLCALGKGLTTLLGTPGELPTDVMGDVITSISDSARILTNLFHRVSMTRKNLINPMLNKSVREQIENCPPIDFLYGSNLSDKIKLAKTLESVTKDLRPPTSAATASRKFSVQRGGGTQVRYTPRNREPSLNTQRPARQLSLTKPYKGQLKRSFRWESDKQAPERKDRRRQRN